MAEREAPRTSGAHTFVVGPDRKNASYGCAAPMLEGSLGIFPRRRAISHFRGLWKSAKESQESRAPYKRNAPWRAPRERRTRVTFRNREWVDRLFRLDYACDPAPEPTIDWMGSAQLLQLNCN